MAPSVQAVRPPDLPSPSDLISDLDASLAQTSREALRQAITAKAIDDKIDENAGLGREQCSGGVVDRDRPAIGVPLWHQSYECALFEMRQSVRHGDERHAEPEQGCAAHRFRVVEYDRLLQRRSDFRTSGVSHAALSDS